MSNFKNRIISTTAMNPLEVKANAKNWRVHPKQQKAALEGVLSEVGWVQDVIVNQRTNRLVDGHLRVALAIENKEQLIPVKFVDLSEEEEALVLATIDPISAMAEADPLALDALLRDVKTSDAAVQSLLSSLYEQEINDLANVSSDRLEDDLLGEAGSTDFDEDIADGEVKVQFGGLSTSISNESMDALIAYLRKQISENRQSDIQTELTTLLEEWIGELP